MKIERDWRKKILSRNHGQDPGERLEIEYDLEKENRQSDREVEKTLREKVKKVGEVNQNAQVKIQTSEKEEHRIAQKTCWIVIDKVEIHDQEVGVDADVESWIRSKGFWQLDSALTFCN